MEDMKQEMINENQPLDEIPVLITTPTQSGTSGSQKDSSSLWEEFDFDVGQTESQVSKK